MSAVVERFRVKYEISADGCWRWTAAISADRYARFLVNGRNTLAHRWAYEEFIGPIPDGLTIDHLCRVRHCVNPEHMEPVPFRENIARRDVSNIGIRNREKTHCPNGHLYDAANTRISTDRSGTHRSCRTCGRLMRRSKQRAA